MASAASEPFAAIICPLSASSSLFMVSLLHEGRAKVPDIICNLSGSELKVEVMEEKLLHDLTREVCSVLWVIQRSACFICRFLLLHVSTALPALGISVEVFSWADSEAVTKVIPFCGALIHLAVATNQAELRQFVSKDLFSSIIQGLSVESNSIMSAELVDFVRRYMSIYQIKILLLDR
jgi:exportin-5